MHTKTHTHEFGRKADDLGPMNFAETLLTGRPVSRIHPIRQDHGPKLKAYAKPRFGRKCEADMVSVSVKKRNWTVWLGLIVALVLGG